MTQVHSDAPWTRRRQLTVGRHVASADAASAASVATVVIPALGPVPPLLVRTKIESDPGQ
ncbi:MAG TPA: hypothetical protein VKB37_11940 [Jatrophihabitantaceae bacterium]|nr:hypothetical protein [Jatrophihabitantaceae bacterium]